MWDGTNLASTSCTASLDPCVSARLRHALAVFGLTPTTQRPTAIYDETSEHCRALGGVRYVKFVAFVSFNVSCSSRERASLS